MDKILDVELSTEIITRIKSKSKDSFDKAYKAALLIEGAIYVQGFLVINAKPYKPIEHSWVEIDERIVDPSFSSFNKNAEELFYFRAQQLDVEELKASVEEALEDYPGDEPLPVFPPLPHEYYGNKMMGGKDYTEAYQKAEDKSKELKKKL